MINRSLDQLNKDVETLESKQISTNITVIEESVWLDEIIKIKDENKMKVTNDKNSSELDMRSCYAL